MEEDNYKYVRKALKTAKTLSHFAFLGVAAVTGSQYLSADNPVLVKLNDVSNTVQQRYADFALKEKNLDVFENVQEIREIVNFLYNEGQFNDLRIKNELVKEDSKNLQSSYASSTYDDCRISIRLSKEKNEVLEHNNEHPILNYNAQDLIFNKQKVYAHEFGHCVFGKDRDVFKIKNGEGGIFSQINKAYGGDTYSHYEIDESGVLSSTGLKNATIQRLANESYAEAFSAITLLRQHNASDDVKSFLYKASARRDLTTTFWDYNFKDISGYKIDPYDIGKTITKVLEPETVKKVLEASSPQELRDLAASVSKENTLEALSKLSPSDLDESLGKDFLKKQAITSIGTKGFATGKIRGEYLVNDFFVSMAKATDKDVRRLVAESHNLKEKTSLSDAPVGEKLINLKKYGDISNEIYNSQYRESFESGKDALFEEVDKVRKTLNLKDKKTEQEVIDEYKQNIANLENPKSAKGEKTEIQLLDEAQKDIGLRLDDIKSLRHEFLDENKPGFGNKKPMKGLS